MNILPEHYRQRVYAGWIGKCIGVRFGAPIENWTYKEIRENLGILDGYLPLQPGKLFKPDDDTAFPMVLIRALRDWKGEISAETFAEGMLNYLADQRGTLWWGGYGISTEHTAYLNLANGISPSISGSAALNGSALAEQIGGQIFSDIWGLVYPNNPLEAARISEMASSISHDGEALQGARYIAALASLAFSFTSSEKLVRDALIALDPDSIYAQMVHAMLAFHAEHPHDWEAAYHYVFENFGYDRYAGVVPVIPNAAVIVLALLYGEGDYSRTICIGNMCGWDTDCNVGNLGAIMAVAVGLEGIDEKWRSPMQDELVLASIIGADNYLDIAECADRIADCAERLADIRSTRKPQRYHFSYPGSTQGWKISGEEPKIVQLWNTNTDPAQQTPGLCAVIKKLGKKSSASWYVKTSVHTKELTANYYGASFSPKLYPGQRVHATLHLPEDQCPNLLASIYIRDRNTGLTHQSQGVRLSGTTKLEYAIERIENAHISEVGIVVHHTGEGLVNAKVILQNLWWEGEADYCLDFSKERAEAGAITQWTFHRGFWRLEDASYVGSGPQDAETYTGSPDWADYSYSARIRSDIGSGHGILARVQGYRRRYALVLSASNRIVLLKKNKGQSIELGSATLLNADDEHIITLQVKANHLTALVDGKVVLEYTDEQDPYLSGKVGLLQGGGGRMTCLFVDVRPN